MLAVDCDLPCWLNNDDNGDDADNHDSNDNNGDDHCDDDDNDDGNKNEDSLAPVQMHTSYSFGTSDRWLKVQAAQQPAQAT